MCSDSSAGTVDEDSFTAELYDVGVPCVTEPKIIKKFLIEKSDQPRIIFTTYQSGQVLAKAAKSIKHKFDLGIMDEAHKTVGRKDKVFAHLVGDKNIKIDRRVYMTATERFYRGSSQEIISMDDPDLYGDTFELLTFKQAIETDNIICDYRFVTIGIAQSEITALWENNDYLRVEGTELNEDTTRSLASGLALRKAYSELGVKRAISFHKSIKLASRFKEQQEQLAEVDCFHVSSKTSTGKRNVQLREFAGADRGLITNARCLTEGVDIPSVDCVLFADPRQSKVDIVQAAGRAMRKSDGKKNGFIIVPLVVPDKLDLETFADTTAFANVVTIIKALAAEDERIVEYLRVISTGKSVDVGERVETEFTEVPAEKVDAAVFLENLKLKVWDKVAKLNWRPFEEARGYVHSLGLTSQDEWVRLRRSGNLPADIPRAPWLVYANAGWVGFGDWLGTGNRRGLDQWMDFYRAREIVRGLNLKSWKEWKDFCKSEKKIPNIPVSADLVYREAGWRGIGDWLGTGGQSTRNKTFLAFREARAYARRQGLKNLKEWRVFRKSGRCRQDVPGSPDQVYAQEGWKDWSDWLGSKNTRSHLPFKAARRMVRGLHIRSNREWRQVCAEGKLPSNIPSNPQSKYRNSGWVNWNDWLGK